MSTTSKKSVCRKILDFLNNSKRTFIIVVTPLALLPLIFVIGTQEAKGGYIILLMTVYWVAEVMPMGITALFPVILVPLFKIMPSKDICPAYFKDSNMLFLGGLMLATSIEYWQLHKRIALRVMMLSGVQPRRLLLGFMIPTWILSMWISNTATTSMMLPIADAVLFELKKNFEKNDADAAEAAAAAELGADNKGLDMTEIVLQHAKEQHAREQHAKEHGAAHNPHIQKAPSLEDITEGVVLENGKDPKDLNKQFSVTSNRSNLCSTEHDGVRRSLRLRRTTSRQEQILQDIGSAWKINLNKKENQINVQEEMDLKDYINCNKNPEFTSLSRMYLVGIAFGSGFGGLCTITGTAPNVIINGMVAEFFGPDTGLNYSNWIFFATPVSILCLIFGWAWLQVCFLGPRALFRRKQLIITEEREKTINDNIRTEYENLGTIKFAEVMVIMVFAITIILWVAREPGAPGWIIAFRDEAVIRNGTTIKKTMTYMSDAQPAILMTIVMFLLPSQLPCWRESNDAPLEIDTVVSGKHGKKLKKLVKSATILNWEMVHKGVPWQLFLLLGGGFALAETSKVSGLSDWVGSQLAVFESIPLIVLVFIVAFTTAIITEVTSNGTAATLLLPIYASLAPKIGIHPFFLMLSCTLSCSFAFNLPIATPTNVLIYSKGYLRLQDLVKSGIVMFMVANCLSVLATMTWGAKIFDLWVLPVWANRNTTFKA